jgi:hypothetical protein
MLASVLHRWHGTCSQGRPAVQALPYRRGRLRRPTVALHVDRPCFSFGTIGLTDGLRSTFTGPLGANLGAGDPGYTRWLWMRRAETTTNFLLVDPIHRDVLT